VHRATPRRRAAGDSDPMAHRSMPARLDRTVGPRVPPAPRVPARSRPSPPPHDRMARRDQAERIDPRAIVAPASPVRGDRVRGSATAARRDRLSPDRVPPAARVVRAMARAPSCRASAWRARVADPADRLAPGDPGDRVVVMTAVRPRRAQRRPHARG
jgi:hypothetical protein